MAWTPQKRNSENIFWASNDKLCSNMLSRENGITIMQIGYLIAALYLS